MKTVSKILALFALMALFTRCEKKPDPEPQVEIPDVNFRNALLALGIDTDGNGIISPSEAAAVDYLDVSASSITSLEGISSFVNLAKLICQENRLTSLDLSGNTELLELNCAGNLISMH